MGQQIQSFCNTMCPGFKLCSRALCAQSHEMWGKVKWEVVLFSGVNITSGSSMISSLENIFGQFHCYQWMESMDSDLGLPLELMAIVLDFLNYSLIETLLILHRISDNKSNTPETAEVHERWWWGRTGDFLWKLASWSWMLLLGVGIVEK